jgi:hypothetical protein
MEFNDRGKYIGWFLWCVCLSFLKRVLSPQDHFPAISQPRTDSCLFPFETATSSSTASSPSSAPSSSLSATQSVKAFASPPSPLFPSPSFMRLPQTLPYTPTHLPDHHHRTRILPHSFVLAVCNSRLCISITPFFLFSPSSFIFLSLFSLPLLSVSSRRCNARLIWFTCHCCRKKERERKALLVRRRHP